MGWEIPPHITPHEGDVYSNFPGIFLFLELLLLLAVASSGPLLRGSSFFSWGPSYFLTLGVTNWFLFGERFLPLGKTSSATSFQDHYWPATPWKKIFFFLGLEKETRQVFHSIFQRSLLSLLLALVIVAKLCLILCDSMDCSLPAPLSMEFSRQEY